MSRLSDKLPFFHGRAWIAHQVRNQGSAVVRVGIQERKNWLYLRVMPLQSFHFDRGRISRIQLSQGRRSHMHLKSGFCKTSTQQCHLVSPEWALVWHSLHLNTFPEPYL